jgi:outer membrane protein TolC
MRKFLTLFTFWGLAFWGLTLQALPLFAEATKLDSLEAVGVWAKAHNLDYRKAAWEAQKALDAIPGRLRLDKSTMSLSSQYSGSASTPASTPATGAAASTMPTFSASLNLPIVDQLGLSFKTDQDLNGQAGITISPLVQSTSKDQARLAWEKAALAAGNTGLNVQNSAIKAFLASQNAQRNLKTQESTVALKEIAYQDQKERYTEGEATLDDVRDALLEWSTARSGLGKARQAALKAEADLTFALNTDTDSITLPVIDVEGLTKELEKLKAENPVEALTAALTYEVQSAQKNVSSAKLTYDSTRIFDPDLVLGANLSYSATTGTAYSATATLSFGYESWKADTKAEYRTDLELAQSSAAKTLANATMTLNRAVAALVDGAENTAIQKLQLSRNTELLSETEFLATTGDASKLELEEATLAVQASQDALFSALVEEYSAWLDLLQYRK